MNFKTAISNFLRGDEGGGTGNVVKIGDNNYRFDVFLYNGETKMGITYGSIQELTIIDDLRYFFSYGYIKFNDSQDVFESFNGINGEGNITPYTFRGDGRDYLDVEIMPQMEDNDNCVASVSEKDKKEFCLKYTFSIYKIEEEVMEDRGVKYKKAYFWDVDYQFLNEIDSHFSTSEVNSKGNGIVGGFFNNKETQNISSNTLDNKKLSNTDDFKRYTGDSIKRLLEKCFKELTTVGFKASREWDRGGGLIEYHTQSGNKAIDDLEYLLDYHVSEATYGYVPCFLRKERYTEEYSLIPVTTYTQNSFYNGSGGGLGGLISSISKAIGGRNMTEDFYIGKVDTSGGSGLGNGLNFGSLNSPNSFNAINYNIVENYTFLKPEADMIQNDVSTHFVHSYDPDGFFTCSIGENNFKKSTKSIFDDNIKNLPNSSNGSGYDILPKNQLREQNKNVQHVYSAGLGIGQNFQKLNFGRNKALIASIFKNTAIYFRIRGLTKRKAGTFFNLNRTDNQLKNQHDKDLLGTYFTTMVIHEFKKGMYYNHMYATKPSSSEKQTFAEML
jgi:hypothetical protein